MFERANRLVLKHVKWVIFHELFFMSHFKWLSSLIFKLVQLPLGDQGICSPKRHTDPIECLKNQFMDEKLQGDQLLKCRNYVGLLIREAQVRFEFILFIFTCILNLYLIFTINFSRLIWKSTQHFRMPVPLISR